MTNDEIKLAPRKTIRHSEFVIPVIQVAWVA